MGSVVLVSMGILMWPLIFTSKQSEKNPVLVEIPPTPEIEKVSRVILNLKKLQLEEQEIVPSELPSEHSEILSVVDQTFQKDQMTRDFEKDLEGRGRIVAPETPKLDESGLPIAYVLQVASMADKSRAVKMIDSLVELEYKAYMREAQIGQVTMYRVYIGPKFEKNNLVSKKSKIDKTFSVDSVILRYSP